MVAAGPFIDNRLGGLLEIPAARDRGQRDA